MLKAPRIIYILTNKKIEGIKVGKTRDLEKRIKDLSSQSGVPYPFDCYYACTVTDEDFVEREIQNIFRDVRSNKKKEFFNIDPDRVKDVLQLVAIKDVTPKNQEKPPKVKKIVVNVRTKEGKKPRNPKPRTKFSKLQIPLGATLQFIKNNEITCSVASDTEVKYNGKVSSISVAATEILRNQYNQSMTNRVNGFAYFKYNGEIISSIRNRMEKS